MEEMQLTTELTWIEVQFAKKAVEEVLRCRTTLKWTYAMAYYLEKSNAKELFEDNQRSVIFSRGILHLLKARHRDLEKAVEDLSELLESPIEPETIPDLRSKMTNKTVGMIRLSSENRY
jgi:ariadne-1